MVRPVRLLVWDMGRRIARSVPERRLTYALVGMFLAPAPYLAFHS
ncbi:hypothetical protein P8A22_17415 [Streptomyces laculatispora]|uniref:Uncharacterized protein n=1 Tax=Streptomyces laculatispora TaxID=887464 RepID=A0ABY9I5Y5_9ACTN|nr:hypothetical protein [Streptomyces laculatispora]WLQ41607.1 hypothetical protein P8A22_17415 [Streptomyces laculatispora]